MIETLVSIFLLSIGLVSMGALMSRMVGDGSRSRYMSMAAMLASEKLEDLNRFPGNDPIVYVPVGDAFEGSITADAPPKSITSPLGTQTVEYWDEVKLASGNGAFSETINGRDAGGNTTYTTITHQPDGTVIQAVGLVPPPPVGTLAFKRRWTIEADSPIVGVRRITVFIALEDPTVQPPVTFQTSMVRP
jgi:Tfp pilus assembly protein PilV